MTDTETQLRIEALQLANKRPPMEGDTVELAERYYKFLSDTVDGANISRTDADLPRERSGGFSPTDRMRRIANEEIDKRSTVINNYVAADRPDVTVNVDSPQVQHAKKARQREAQRRSWLRNQARSLGAGE